MKKNFSAAFLLPSFLLTLMLWGCVNNPALAVRYTQIFQTATPNVAVPVSNTPPQASPTYYGNTPTISAGTVYQGQIRQAMPIRPVRISQYATQPLQLPQAILDNLKAKNEIPANVAQTISVEKSNVLNSYTDGQQIVITSNLLDKLTTNDERAFVISHELSHVLLSHVTKTEVRRVGLSLLDTYLIRRYVGQGTALDLATQFGLNMVDKKSSRGYEYQADDLGVRLMSQAGYDPEAAVKVFDILKANTPANQTPGFLMDHPITDDRIRVLIQKYQLKPE